MPEAPKPRSAALALPDTPEDASNELPALARMALQCAHLQWIEIECHIAWCNDCLTAHMSSEAQAKAAAQLSGIGPITASALVASMGDFTQFKTAAQFGAWLGLVPSQNSNHEAGYSSRLAFEFSSGHRLSAGMMG